MCVVVAVSQPEADQVSHDETSYNVHTSEGAGERETSGKWYFGRTLGQSCGVWELTFDIVHCVSSIFGFIVVLHQPEAGQVNHDVTNESGNHSAMEGESNELGK